MKNFKSLHCIDNLSGKTSFQYSDLVIKYHNPPVNPDPNNSLVSSTKEPQNIVQLPNCQSFKINIASQIIPYLEMRLNH